MRSIIKTKDGRILSTQGIFSIEPRTSSEVSSEFVNGNYTAEEWAEIKAYAPYGRTVRGKDDMPMFHTVDMPIAGYSVNYKAVISTVSTVIHPDDYKKLLDVLQCDEDEQTICCSALTQDVFKLPDCPDWAEYAAIDGDGNAYYYEKKPQTDYTEWGLDARGDGVKPIDGVWYKDWMNSLIKRER